MTLLPPAIRRHLPRLLAAGIAAVVLVTLGARVVADWQRLSSGGLRQSMHLDAPLLAAAWALQTVGWLLMVLAWRAMLGEAGGRVPLRRHLPISAFSALAHVVPGSIAAPVSRVALYRRERVSAVTVSTALVVEWLVVGLAGLAIYAACAPRAAAGSPGGLALLLGVAAVAVVTLYPPLFARIGRWAARRLGGDAEAVTVPRLRDLAAWFVVEVAVLALSGAALHVVMLAVTPRGGLADALAAWGMAMAVANLLAWLPASGIVREAGLVMLLAPLYGTSVVALGVVVVWHLWMVFVQLSWAGIATALTLREQP